MRPRFGHQFGSLSAPAQVHSGCPVQQNTIILTEMNAKTQTLLSESVELCAVASELRWQLHETLERHREIRRGIVAVRLRFASLKLLSISQKNAPATEWRVAEHRNGR
jgi:hypothetical protein